VSNPEISGLPRVVHRRHLLAQFLLLPLLVVTCIAAILEPELASVIPAGVVLVGSLLLSWKRLAPLWQSPALIFAVVMTPTALFGFTFGNQLADLGGTGGANTTLSGGDQVATLWLFVAAQLLVLACAAATAGSPARANFPSVAVTPRIVAGALTLAASVLILSVAYRGIGWYLERPLRFSSELGNLESLLTISSIASCVLLGLVIASTESSFARFWAIVLVLSYSLMFFAMGSRNLALAPILVFLGMVLSGRHRLRVYQLLVVGALVAVLWPIPLVLRNQASHGLFPYVTALPSADLGSDLWLASINNVLSGFNIVGTTAFVRPQISASDMATSISLLGGSEAGWYEVASRLRLNHYTPYGAIGEIANQGIWVAVVSFCVLGVIFGFVQRVGRKLSDSAGGQVYYLVPLGLSILLVLQATQYNLRSEMRLLYYALGAAVIGLVVHATHSALARRSEGRSVRLKSVLGETLDERG